MDMVKMGAFLKELRLEQNLTQEQLGEKIGVTNKTVSRWETGTYMPPVECLEILSDLYKVSINELISGERLQNEDFKSSAEDNLKSALKTIEKVKLDINKLFSIIKKVCKWTLNLGWPILIFYVLYLPYFAVLQSFIGPWLGHGHPMYDSSGNTIYPSSFNANDFTMIFWFSIAALTTLISVFISKKIKTDKLWLNIILRAVYILLILAVSLLIAISFSQGMMAK